MIIGILRTVSAGANPWNLLRRKVFSAGLAAFFLLCLLSVDKTWGAPQGPMMSDPSMSPHRLVKSNGSIPTLAGPGTTYGQPEGSPSFLLAQQSDKVPEVDNSTGKSSETGELEKALVKFHKDFLNSRDLASSLALPFEVAGAKLLDQAKLVVDLGGGRAAVVKVQDSQIKVDPVRIPESDIPKSPTEFIETVMRKVESPNGPTDNSGPVTHIPTPIPGHPGLYLVQKIPSAAGLDPPTPLLVEKCGSIIPNELKIRELTERLRKLDQSIAAVTDSEKRERLEKMLDAMVQKAVEYAVFRLGIEKYIAVDVAQGLKTAQTAMGYGDVESAIGRFELDAIIQEYIRGSIDKDGLRKNIEAFLTRFQRNPTTIQDVDKIMAALGARLDRARELVQKTGETIKVTETSDVMTHFEYLNRSMAQAAKAEPQQPSPPPPGSVPEWIYQSGAGLLERFSSRETGTGDSVMDSIVNNLSDNEREMLKTMAMESDRSLAGLGSMVAALNLPGAKPSPQSGAPLPRYTIQEALAKGLVTAVPEGTGNIYGDRAMRLVVRKTTNDPFILVVPQGTVFRSKSGLTQNMVIR